MAVNAIRNNILSKIFIPSLVNARHVKRWEAPKLIELLRRKKEMQKMTEPKILLDRTRRSKFLEWNRAAEIYAFGKRLQEDFRLELLSLAFVHRSHIVAQKEKLDEFQVHSAEMAIEDNNKLSEIGVQIISDYVWNYFSHSFPRFPLEGIESVFNHLISVDVLAEVSKNIGTSDIILSSDYPAEKTTLAKTFQAIVGALMESQGIERSNLLVRDLIVTQFCGKDINDFLPVTDYFQLLCDILKRDGLEAEPRIICQTATNTILANYHIGIYCNKKFFGHGSGESVDTAIQMAALDVLKRFFCTTDSAAALRYDLNLSYEGKVKNNLPLSEWSLSKFNKT